MNSTEWLLVLVVGAVAGAVGQLVRAIAGLAGANRTSAGQPAEALDLSRLLVSTLVGATAGAMAALTMNDKLQHAPVPPEVILGLVAAGYAGADFIEGVAGKFGRAGADSPTGPTPPPPPPVMPAPQVPSTGQTTPVSGAVG
ncbi:hypothetical protein KAK06_21510 [Ideonella sp. 4Y11]|uniref:Uncharacterized protein n=1 Tax=Ideonella aquatica TaxID=2824119 RepID=A0A940YS95_9BURK|nr:hypothetical protein [Ideonella aquatica]MBQ0961531.1 hypothetical protein [Ideonella aquatica]